MLVRAVGQKHNKIARLRMAPDPITDPEREKMELMKQSAKKSKRKADMEDSYGGGRRTRAGYSRKRMGHDVWSDDGDEEERQEFEPSDEEEEEEADGGRGNSPRKRVATGDEKKGVGEYQEDDFVVADSSDEEAGPEGEGGKIRKHRNEEDYMEEDHLEKMDAKIKEQEDEKRRRQRRPGEAQAGDEDDAEAETEEGDEGNEEMEVESEDEEEEFKIRRVGGTGGRKKRAIDFDNDDDE